MYIITNHIFVGQQNFLHVIQPKTLTSLLKEIEIVTLHYSTLSIATTHTIWRKKLIHTVWDFDIAVSLCVLSLSRSTGTVFDINIPCELKECGNLSSEN